MYLDRQYVKMYCRDSIAFCEITYSKAWFTISETSSVSSLDFSLNLFSIDLSNLCAASLWIALNMALFRSHAATKMRNLWAWVLKPKELRIKQMLIFSPSSNRNWHVTKLNVNYSMKQFISQVNVLTNFLDDILDIINEVFSLFVFWIRNVCRVLLIRHNLMRFANRGTSS